MTPLSHAPLPASHPLQIFIVIILYHFKVCNKGASKIHPASAIFLFFPSFIVKTGGFFVNIAEKNDAGTPASPNALAPFSLLALIFLTNAVSNKAKAVALTSIQESEIASL